jgi:hypothetical protein
VLGPWGVVALVIRELFAVSVHHEREEEVQRGNVEMICSG